MAERRLLEAVSRDNYMGGVPRKMVIASVGLIAKTMTAFFNKTSVINGDTLIRHVRHRPQGVSLITVSNHMSTLDDPLLWGFPGFPSMDSRSARWVLTARDICFNNPILSYFFRLGKCIPITRGEGIYQEHMNEVLELLNDGEWVHVFPEGKVSQEEEPVRRLKWGTASLIIRAPSTPIVLPIVHHGFHKVMPEKYLFNRRPLLPLWNKNIKIMVGEPMHFDVPKLRELAISKSTNGDGSDETEKCLLQIISHEIRTVMENLRRLIASNS